MTYGITARVVSCGAALAWLGGFIPTPALAQPEAASQEARQSARQPANQSVLEVITVTAQKREENIQDVPLSVSAISGSLLEDQQVSSVIDLSQLSPSITYTQSTNPLNSSLRIRGIGTDVFSSAVEPSVSFVVDGVVMSRQGQAFADLIDIERIEVLRGPQSTLFGKNASAGVVSIITRDPGDEFEATVEAIAAELDEYQVRGTVSGPLGEMARGSLTGYYKDIGGHIDNAFGGDDLNGSESYGLRGKLLLDLSDRMELKLIADYRESEDKCCAWQYRRVTSGPLASELGVVQPSSDNRTVNVDAPVLNETEQWGLSGELTWDIGEFTFTSITAVREWDFGNQIDIDGTPSLGTSTVLTGGLVGFGTNNGTTELSQISQEFRLQSPGDRAVRYVVGGFFSDLDLDRRFERRICLINLSDANCPAQIPLSPTFAIPGGQSGFFEGSVKNQNIALFGQVDVDLNDRLTLTIGGRVLRDEVEFRYNRPNEPLPQFPNDAVDGAGGPAGQRDSGEVSDDAITGKLALRYSITDDVSIYGSYSRGYKGPTVDVAYESDSRPIDPEESDAFELGLKSVLLEGRATLNVALFDVTYDDYQAQTFDAGEGSFILSNAGQVSTRGVEADLNLLIGEALFVGVGAAYTDAEIDDFPGGQCFNPVALDTDCGPDGTKPLDGGVLNNAPEWKFNANLRYDWQLDGAPFNLFVTGAYRWQDDVQFAISQNPNTIQDSYGILDASFGLEGKEGRYRVTVFGKNLTDDNYAAFLLQDPVQTGTLNVAHYLPKNAERYFGISFRANF